MKTSKVLLISLLLLAPFSAAAMDAQQYDARLCSAQLLVLQGDLRQFLDQTTSDKDKRVDGYRQRIVGALGPLNWLCRHYAALYTVNTSQYQGEINRLKIAISDAHWHKVRQLLDTLTAQIPLQLKGLRAVDANFNSVQTGKEIYNNYCQACHNQPDFNQARPAYSLFKMAKTLAENEFIARMILGVHGTPEIALQNPLTDDDISGMFNYFLNEKPLVQDK